MVLLEWQSCCTMFRLTIYRVLKSAIDGELRYWVVAIETRLVELTKAERWEYMGKMNMLMMVLVN